MTLQALDHPFLAALTGRQAHLARWNADRTACRIAPDYGPFAAALAGQEAALVDLLRDASDEIWLVQAQGLAVPDGLVIKRRADLVQMVARDAPPVVDSGDMVLLTQEDAPAMAALAHATQPGPWGPKTHLYGAFYGIKQGDRLVAMAGERARPAEGITEVSGVCTDPAYRGRGYARRLICHVMAGLAARGEAAYLHSWASNAGAIALYEQLGFQIRASMVASVLALG
ncbi:GNAT family N-acetyltransferase [Novosphingobium umbonatum]|uniref:GNAT family N-acetyltransferase n=1 Tax=Novosphingobium umbonatum TaxID=1908524 RepID=A0A437MX46_9SPHN|nr:GNAT family N-acetyltransferase [Novosphingobium umbonatum]RVU02230.1 GNAT family N-acetyltransferase [Novosphingobium umbonatum]